MRPVKINENATYYPRTGVVKIGDEMIQLTIGQEQFFAYLLKQPRIPATWEELMDHLATSKMTVRHYVLEVRHRLGRHAIRTHHNRGVSLQPQYVGVR